MMEAGKTFRITELSDKAFKRAIRDERAVEWDGRRKYDGEMITEEDIVAFSLLCGSRYDESGNWLCYETEAEDERF